MPQNYIEEGYSYVEKVNPQNGWKYNTFEQSENTVKQQLSRNNKLYYAGIISFLQYAFLSIAGRLSQQTFFIKKLEGFNDFIHVYNAELALVTQEIEKIQNKKPKPPEFSSYKIKKNLLEQSFHPAEERLVLKDVLVQTESFDDNQMSEKITILFKYGQKYWNFEYDQRKQGFGDQFSIPWNFIEITEKEALEKYKQLTKPIIMKNKIASDDQRTKASGDWLDFQKVEGYDSSKLLLFQIFDLYPKVRELRG